MSTRPPAEDHDHDDATATDWFKVLDILVWVGVAVIGILALEWFIGLVVREKISRGASRYLKSTVPATPEPEA